MKYEVTMKIKKTINANSVNDAKYMAKYLIENIFGTDVKSEVTCDFKEIMDCLSGHNRKLVDLINLCYNIDKQKFNFIVNTLAKRDLDECFEKDIRIPVTDESYYLKNVADDEDLKTIINFFRLIDENGNYILV